MQFIHPKQIGHSSVSEIKDNTNHIIFSVVIVWDVILYKYELK